MKAHCVMKLNMRIHCFILVLFAVSCAIAASESSGPADNDELLDRLTTGKLRPQLTIQTMTPKIPIRSG
uniref:Putative cell adhesion molecule n=1 Tax=Anopheles darlingi TaxID=43151 RepID=A0A2M4DPB2_ANODA